MCDWAVLLRVSLVGYTPNEPAQLQHDCTVGHGAGFKLGYSRVDGVAA